MSRNGNRSSYDMDERDELIAMLIFVAGLIAFGLYMVAIWKVDFVSNWTRFWGMFFGVIVYIYTFAMIVFGLIVLVKLIGRIAKEGFSRKMLWLLLSVIGMFFVGQLLFNFLLWGVLKQDAGLRMMCIPVLIIAVPSVAYIMHYLAAEA